MKKIFILFCTTTIFLACNISGEKEGIEKGETWKLIESRVSIGGPAEYSPVDHEEFIEFLSDSKVRKSNGWCREGSPTEVRYSENGTIFTNCNGSGTIVFKKEGDHLILRSPNCIEACDYKYEKVAAR